MRTYYVSMAADLLGVYIAFEASSRKAVNQYLERQYYRNGVWKLLWCSIYEEIPYSAYKYAMPVIVRATCGTLEEEVESDDGQ